MIPSGMLGDRIGRKRVLLAALGVFGLGSLGCAFAGGPASMITARVVLGLGAAAVVPLSLAAVTTLFAEPERPKALAVIMTVTMLGFPIGPIVGGWLVTNAWWGWVFLINVPVVVVGAIAVAVLLPPGSAAAAGPVDGTGILT